MLARVTAAALLGVQGRPITVETHLGKGLPAFVMVGLPDAGCREARDRVRAAIYSSGMEWPVRHMTVNLAPSSFPKHGSGTDLAIAIGVLTTIGDVAEDATQGWGFIGELGLDGSLRPVLGIVPMVAALRGAVRGVVVPAASAAEAALVPGVEVRCAENLDQVVRALDGRCSWPDPPPEPTHLPEPQPDLADVRGHPVARFVLEVAAAGGHHLLLAGPPGAGKTMLASRLPGLMPELDEEAALEVTAIHSAAGEPTRGLHVRPPFRAPHHTASAVSLIGGGTGAMRPGEISLAHRGVLFADELGEFAPTVLDALRQPLEEGVIRVTRARGRVSYPASFQLVAATNPCPCGPPAAGCRCSDASRARYLRRLSGPLLDRFDLRMDLDRPDASDLLSTEPGEPSASVRQRVERARRRAADRGVTANSELGGDALERAAPLTPEAVSMLEAMLRSGALTARGVHRIRRVALTIADLGDHDGHLSEEHVATAVALRVPVAGADVAVAS